jgi:hypothetical protein
MPHHIKKGKEPYKTFIDNLVLLVVKRLPPLDMVENLWMKQFSLKRNPQVVFP